jgi:hypothetical protein
MSWLNAHESYVMETIARDRVEELHSTLDLATDTERIDAPADVQPAARPGLGGTAVLRRHTLAKAS